MSRVRVRSPASRRWSARADAIAHLFKQTLETQASAWPSSESLQVTSGARRVPVRGRATLRARVYEDSGQEGRGETERCDVSQGAGQDRCGEAADERHAWR